MREGSAYIKVVRLVENLGVKRALDIVEETMTARYAAEGLAVGLGEVGRPHYNASRLAVKACNLILDLSLKLAKDLDRPIHLHLERKRDTIRMLLRGFVK